MITTKILTLDEVEKNIHQKKTTLLIFGTTWCPDCKMFDLLLASAMKEWSDLDDFSIVYVDAEKADVFRKTESAWQVAKVPSIYVIKNGQKRHLGYEFIPMDWVHDALRNNKNGAQ